MKKAKQKIYLSSLDGIECGFEANWYRDGFCYVTRTVRDIWEEYDYEYGLITVNGVDLVVENDGHYWTVSAYETKRMAQIRHIKMRYLNFDDIEDNQKRADALETPLIK